MLELESTDGLKGLVLSTPVGTHIIYPLDNQIDFATLIKNNLK